MGTIKEIIGLSCLISCVLFSGCTMIPTSVSSIEQTEKARKLLKKNSMIFGRLVSETPGYFFSLNTTHQNSKHKYTIMAPPAGKLFSKYKQDNRDGYFFAFLPAGNYKINGIAFFDVNYAGGIKTDMSFTVPEDSAVYLGTISFSWESVKNYLLVQKGNIQYSVKDERDEAFYRFWKRFPELKTEGLNAVVGIIEIKDGYSLYENNLNLDDNNNGSDQDGSEEFKYHSLTSENINSR